MQIILADDHIELRKAIRAILEAQPGMTVIAEAADGFEAVVKTLSLNPDIVVMDAKMPILDGIEATRYIVATLPAVQIVMISMFADRKIVSAAYRAGIKGYVTKDCIDEDLVPAIQALINHYTIESACSQSAISKW